MRTLVWRGLDAPRMEVAHVESWQQARGTQIGIAYELRWELECDRLQVTLDDDAREFALGDADFFDLLDSAFFNSLPVVRDGLLAGGPPHDYLMRFISHPPLADRPLRQRYTPVRDHVVRYAAEDFEADIEFDAEGFVSLYHGYLERVA